MGQLQTLESQAIKAAELQHWDEAIGVNTQILEFDASNISALNRLGFCHIQLSQREKAKTAYQKVLKIDPYNTIAKKYLTLLSGTATILPTQSQFKEDFIEEPGKTKTVSLCRVADPSVLNAVSIATPCKLLVKNHRIAVDTETNTYLGSLPDDLSHTLTKLITGGNEYKTVVKSIAKNACVVFIKELSRSKKYAHVNSFPAMVNARTSGIHEDILIDDAPVDVSETGQEKEFADDMSQDLTPEEPV